MRKQGRLERLDERIDIALAELSPRDLQTLAEVYRWRAAQLEILAEGAAEAEANESRRQRGVRGIVFGGTVNETRPRWIGNAVLE